MRRVDFMVGARDFKTLKAEQFMQDGVYAYHPEDDGEKLAQAMTESIRDGGQVILLLNRRGFSTHIQCPACGGVVRCVDCDIALTHHRTGDEVVCHYCDYRATAPARCPE